MSQWFKQHAGKGSGRATSSRFDARGHTPDQRFKPFMELAAAYDRLLSVTSACRLTVDPSASRHSVRLRSPNRVSAMPSPLAPITHHWLDATHITYGVATGAVYGKRWKAEASVFNGREPAENRTDFDFGVMDSYSGRLWLLPSARWALQVSAGQLTEAEAAHDGGPRIDVERLTASMTYHRRLREGWV